MAERVLITGGAGFIGSHLADALLARGSEVVALDNLSTGSLGNVDQAGRHAEFRFVQGSVLDELIVDKLNLYHSRFEQIKRFAVLSRDFSADEGEVTPTLKLRRKICQQHFAAEIEALYDRSGPPADAVGG